MNEHDVIRHLGRFPDEINPEKRLTSSRWRCSQCGSIKSFQTPVTNPAPCTCGSIGFEVVNDANV